MSKPYRIFIDGSAGTTGLRIRERLAAREDVLLLDIDEAHRKDLRARLARMNEADAAFLCLPDEAAREVAREDPDTILLDTSTAHRTDPLWAYGFPELSPAHRAAVVHGRRIAVPGCHASGFIALIYPLREAGLLPANALLTAFSITGYSGGGKKMIAQYEDAGRAATLDSPRQYALSQRHKHLPEMRAVCHLDGDPLFCPIVADYPSGMEVTIPLPHEFLPAGVSRDDLCELYRRHYAGEPLISVRAGEAEGDGDGFLSAGALAGRDGMEIFVEGCEERILLIARFDNLGKGASGAAVQCMNLALGAPETTSLVF